MIVKQFGGAIALAVAFLAAAAGLRYAASQGFISDDMATRTVQVVIGLGLAAYANVMPKRIGGRRGSIEAETRAQAAQRFGGWAITLAGLAHAGLWAFAPLSFANPASMAVVAGALALTLGYAIWCFTACRRTGSPGGA
ncbi:MAG TPA: hypothetical protein VM348_10310 [Brevundimonas sp.]|nr:hypothetical protein [Brevundimonas sp.]